MSIDLKKKLVNFHIILNTFYRLISSLLLSRNKNVYTMRVSRADRHARHRFEMEQHLSRGCASVYLFRGYQQLPLTLTPSCLALSPTLSCRSPRIVVRHYRTPSSRPGGTHMFILFMNEPNMSTESQNPRGTRVLVDN